MATMAVALDINLFLAYNSSLQLFTARYFRRYFQYFSDTFNTFGERKIRYITSEAAALKVSKRNFITRCYFNSPGHQRTAAPLSAFLPLLPSPSPSPYPSSFSFSFFLLLPFLSTPSSESCSASRISSSIYMLNSTVKMRVGTLFLPIFQEIIDPGSENSPSILTLIFCPMYRGKRTKTGGLLQKTENDYNKHLVRSGKKNEIYVEGQWGGARYQLDYMYINGVTTYGSLGHVPPLEFWK